jgi:hypothetical protein
MEQQEGDDESTEDENSDKDIVAARNHERNKRRSGCNILNKADPATPDNAHKKEEDDHKELDGRDDEGNSEASSYHLDNREEDSSDKDSEDGGTRKDTDAMSS